MSLNFNDQLHIKITDTSGTTSSSPISFPAYLESADIKYKIHEQNVAFAPLTFVNSAIHTRTTREVSLRFNVFASTVAESQQNYTNLNNLLGMIKPQYTQVHEQYVPLKSANTGIIQVYFIGLPNLRDKKIHLTSFEYFVNKDGGYVAGDEILRPVYYTLGISGRILEPFEDTVRGVSRG